MLSVFPGEEAWQGHSWWSVCSASTVAPCKTLNAIFTFHDFHKNEKPPDFFQLTKMLIEVFHINEMV